MIKIRNRFDALHDVDKNRHIKHNVSTYINSVQADFDAANKHISLKIKQNVPQESDTELEKELTQK